MRAAAVAFGQAWFDACAALMLAALALDAWITRHWRGK